jgi:hypothetical protein
MSAAIVCHADSDRSMARRTTFADASESASSSGALSFA